MKIYVSEKDIDLKLLNTNKEMFVGGEFNIESPTDDGYGNYVLAEVEEETEVQSLEQHDKELLNKVKSEMLKSVFNDEYIFGKEKRSLHYALGILDGVVDNLLKERGVE